jgi:hypothetical protein
VLNSIGLWPVVGQDIILIGSPLMRRTSIQLPAAKTFVIEAPNTSAKNKYVTSATLNGAVLDRAWLYWHEIRNGAHLVLTMGASPSTWGSRDRPPVSFFSDSATPVALIPCIQEANRPGNANGPSEHIAAYTINGKRLGYSQLECLRRSRERNQALGPICIIRNRDQDDGHETAIKKNLYFGGEY